MFYALFGILSHFLQFYTSFTAIQPNVFRMTDIRPLPKDVLNVVRLPSSRCTARQNKAGRLDRKADFLCFYVAFVLF